MTSDHATTDLSTRLPALSASELEPLRQFSSPTIANAIETLNARPRLAGITGAGILCHYPDLGPVVGYACTAVIRSAEPPVQPRADRRAYWEYVLSCPGPKLAVMQDLSEPCGGAFWGEVNANIHLALGVSALITSGAVRDLAEVHKLGFHFFSASVQVSHGWAHLERFNCPVTVFGMEVQPGDLIHADRHGAVVIPHDVAHLVAQAAARVEQSERAILAACRAADPIAALDRLVSREY